MFVINFSSCSAEILKSLCSSHSTNFGVPPANKTMSGYETQYGAGIITSSPGLIVASMQL